MKPLFTIESVQELNIIADALQYLLRDLIPAGRMQVAADLLKRIDARLDEVSGS